MAQSHGQSASGRARQDTRRFFEHPLAKIFDGIFIIVFVLATAYRMPDDASNMEWAVFEVVAGVIGALAGLGFIFVTSLVMAPYKQRNEARKIITDKTPSPLEVVCSRYELTLAGEDVFRGKEYLWAMDTTLTNTSDTLHVSTSHVNLRVQHRASDDTVRTFTVALISKSELERVSNRSGRVLEENEYLGPRDSRTGTYYFLDSDMHGQKPIGMSTWPNLVVTDSFGARYTSSFNAPRMATRSTEDSPSEEGS